MASADATPLEPRQRVPGGPTGGVSVLLHAGDEPDFASSSRPSAHVAYPSGDAVVVTEIRAGIASPSPHVFRPSGDRTRPVTFASWAPGDAHRGLLAVGTRDELRLYAPPADDSPPSSPAGDDPDLLLHHRDDLVDASDDSSRWILLDRVALDADVTCAAWTHDAEGIVLATASGFVGACRLRRPEDGRPGDDIPGDDIPETGDDQVQSRWSWRGRASEPQALVAAGPTLDAAAATAAETSLRAVAWRHDPDVPPPPPPPPPRNAPRRTPQAPLPGHVFIVAPVALRRDGAAPRGGGADDDVRRRRDSRLDPTARGIRRRRARIARARPRVRRAGGRANERGGSPRGVRRAVGAGGARG